MRGSEHNDQFEMRGGKIRTSTNYSGGIQGGISNGENIYFRVAFKPTATIAREQKTVTKDRKQTQLAARGRHDPCVLPRAVPMVEAMCALVLVDHVLRQQAITLWDRTAGRPAVRKKQDSLGTKVAAKRGHQEK